MHPALGSRRLSDLALAGHALRHHVVVRPSVHGDAALEFHLRQQLQLLARVARGLLALDLDAHVRVQREERHVVVFDAHQRH